MLICCDLLSILLVLPTAKVVCAIVADLLPFPVIFVVLFGKSIASGNIVVSSNVDQWEVRIRIVNWGWYEWPYSTAGR